MVHLLLFRRYLTLSLLRKARTQSQLTTASQSLETVLKLHSVNASNNPLSEQILERVLKVSSMMDWNHISIPLFDWMLSHDNKTGKDPYLPSDIAYISLFNSLRRTKSLEDMRRAFHTLRNQFEQSTSETISTVALNIFIATLCDFATCDLRHKPGKERSRQRKNTSDEAMSKQSSLTSWKKSTPTSRILVKSIDTEHLITSSMNFIDEAMTLLYPTSHWKQDTQSFNTVLNAITRLQDKDMMNKVLSDMRARGIPQDTCTYNARLKMTLTLNQAKNQTGIEIISLLKEVLEYGTVSPDPFTIELMLPPMSKLGMWSEIYTLLLDFNKKIESKASSYYEYKQGRILSDAYATFLITLIEGGEMTTAERIFDTFLLRPSSICAPMGIKPTTQHFNIMMQGILSMKKGGKISNVTISSETENVTRLYHEMVRLKIPPDSYTISILAGIQQTSQDLRSLWTLAVTDPSFKMNSVVYRSFMSAFSRVNDVSSACLVFGYMLRRNRIEEIYSINNWNVLLKCIGNSCSSNPILPIRCRTSQLYHDLNFNHTSQAQIFIENCIENFLPFESLDKVYKHILYLTDSNSTTPLSFYPNSQTYCIMASAYADGALSNKSVVASELLKDAKGRGIPGDGRFLNALIRCFGDQEAIELWRSQIRSYAFKYDTNGENLRACYHGLIWVAGKACKPDMALRLVYAMKKEFIEVTETALNCYLSGKRSASGNHDGKFMSQYEKLLLVECSKYDQRDKRRSKETRLRIIF